jgi:hypothetical protein
MDLNAVTARRQAVPVFGQRNQIAPELDCSVLPPYEVPDLIVMGGVIVENRGSAPANNIKIVLEFEDVDIDKIRHLQVVSDVEYILRSGGESHSYATLRVRRLAPKQKLVIYFSGLNRVQPRVKVTHYEG